MENKINLVELLKDCPKGMELDCTIFNGTVILESINIGAEFPINIRLSNGNLDCLTEIGGVIHEDLAKCVIFPKGKDTWEGFQRPFKDGDVVATNDGDWVGITTGGKSEVFIPTYCVFKPDGTFKAYLDKKETWQFNKLATEEERKKLFKAIKDNGYKWNTETKTLEKLVVPNFKVGNKIIRKGRKGIDYPIEVLAIENGRYKLPAMSMPIDSQDEWELVSDKFDITTLKPFESRVLVRNADGYLWKPAIYGFPHSKMCYVVGGLHWVQCIPYEENKHLIGTTDDCSDFYKTWEK